MTNERKFRYIVFLDAHSKKWIAQGLEVDICAQGDTEQLARSNFKASVFLEAGDVDDGDVFKIGPAPKKFFDLWEQDEVLSGQLQVA